MYVLFYKVIVGDEIFIASTTKNTVDAVKNLKWYILSGKLNNPLIIKKIRDSGIKPEDIRAEPIERMHCLDKKEVAARVKYWIRELKATLNVKYKVKELEEYKNKETIKKNGIITLNFD